MKNERSIIIILLTIAALVGNIIFILWMTYNGLQEHFNGTIYEKLSFIGLTLLLIINSYLILRKNKPVVNE